MKYDLLINREISYIIVTGGITNMSGFPYLLDEEFDVEKIICNITPVGIRSNIYSSGFGIIKYIDDKMNFRDIKYTMFDSDDINKLTEKGNKVRQENLISKFNSYLQK